MHVLLAYNVWYLIVYYIYTIADHSKHKDPTEKTIVYTFCMIYYNLDGQPYCQLLYSQDVSLLFSLYLHKETAKVACHILLNRHVLVISASLVFVVPLGRFACHFGKILKVFGNVLRVYLVFEILLNLPNLVCHWAKFHHCKWLNIEK